MRDKGDQIQGIRVSSPRDFVEKLEHIKNRIVFKASPWSHEIQKIPCIKITELKKENMSIFFMMEMWTPKNRIDLKVSNEVEETGIFKATGR